MRLHKKYWQVRMIILIFVIFAVIMITQNINQKIPAIQSFAIFETQRDIICKEFADDILWTSSYTNSQESSANYYAWSPATNCREAGGKECLLQDIIVNSRSLYLAPDEKEPSGEIYIQISKPSESICANPEYGDYATYLAHESMSLIEEQKIGWYCGESKISADAEQDLQCNIKFDEKPATENECYGIKAYASKYAIVDAFKIQYRWCWDASNSINSDGEIKK